MISFLDLVDIFNEKHKSKSRFYQKNKEGKQDYEIVHPSTNSIQAGTSIDFFIASIFLCLIPSLDLHDDDNDITVIIADEYESGSSDISNSSSIWSYYAKQEKDR